MADEGVTVEEVIAAWQRQKDREAESYARAMAMGFIDDAGAYKSCERRAEVLVSSLTQHPSVWPIIAELLKDADYTTWDARLAAVMDTRFPGWRELPLFPENDFNMLKGARRARH
jgi:hypothetical protein